MDVSVINYSVILYSERFFKFSLQKVSKYGVFSGPYFPAFGLNTEIYGLDLLIQFECRKIRTRNKSVFGHFSRSVYYLYNSANVFLELLVSNPRNVYEGV